MKICLDFFGQILVEFFLYTLSRSWLFTQLPLGSCVKISKFGKCENWKNIHNHRTVTSNSQPVIGHYAGKALTGDCPEEANLEGIAASSR
jgi:hypothetical protein